MHWLDVEPGCRPEPEMTFFLQSISKALDVSENASPSLSQLQQIPHHFNGMGAGDMTEPKLLYFQDDAKKTVLVTLLPCH